MAHHDVSRKLGFAVGFGALLLVGACASETPTNITEAPAVQSRLRAPAGEYLVIMTAGPSLAPGTAEVRKIVEEGNGEISGALPHLNILVVTGVTDPAALRAIPGVKDVVPNYEHDMIDPMEAGAFTTLAGLAPTGTNQSTAGFYANFSQWDMRVTQVDKAWAPSKGGLGAKVCITDSGIDGGHSNMIGKVVQATSFIAGQTTDIFGHGSHVAGTISSLGLTGGTASMAPDAKLMDAKVFNSVGGGATTAVVLAAVAWCADNGADIINMSLGFNGGVPVAGNEAFIAAYQTGIDYATNKGVLVVASAGNDNTQIPHATNKWIPAELNGVLSVGATGSTTATGFTANVGFPAGTNFDGKASYSNFGTAVDVFAPGGNRPTTAWAVQHNILSICSRVFNPACVGGTTYLYNAGTSMAAPHVAGLAAIIRSRFSTVPRSLALRNRIERCITSSTQNIGPASTFGGGRINAYRAITLPC